MSACFDSGMRRLWQKADHASTSKVAGISQQWPRLTSTGSTLCLNKAEKNVSTHQIPRMCFIPLFICSVVDYFGREALYFEQKHYDSLKIPKEFEYDRSAGR